MYDGICQADCGDSASIDVSETVTVQTPGPLRPGVELVYVQGDAAEQGDGAEIDTRRTRDDVVTDV